MHPMHPHEDDPDIPQHGISNWSDSTNTQTNTWHAWIDTQDKAAAGEFQKYENKTKNTTDINRR